MSVVENSSYTSVEDSVVAAFKLISTLTPILSFQNGTQPPLPYCYINFVMSHPVGQQEERFIVDKDERKATLSQTFEATVRFQFYGKDKQSGGSNNTAQNYAEDFTMKIRSAMTRMLFADNGLSIMRVGDMKRVPKVKESDIFNTYVIDVVIGYTHYITTVYDTIESVEMTGTFKENITGDITKEIDLGNAYVAP